MTNSVPESSSSSTPLIIFCRSSSRTVTAGAIEVDGVKVVGVDVVVINFDGEEDDIALLSDSDSPVFDCKKSRHYHTSAKNTNDWHT